MAFAVERFAPAVAVIVRPAMRTAKAAEDELAVAISVIRAIQSAKSSCRGRRADLDPATERDPRGSVTTAVNASAACSGLVQVAPIPRIPMSAPGAKCSSPCVIPGR
jgi:hypothetical protein